MEIAPHVRRYQNRADFSASNDGRVAYRPGSDADRQLTWFDRDGHRLGDLGRANDYAIFQLSPDDRRLAVQFNAGGRAEVWIYDVARGSLSRVFTESDEAIAPVWSPDGLEIVFSATTASGMTLVRQRLDTPNREPVLEASRAQIATDWSADGKFLAYSRFQAHAGTFVKAVSDPPNITGRPYGTGGRQYYATFSPSGSAAGPRWLAFSSDESGQDEVYVTEFPAARRRWQVSTNGGWLPHWRRDGRELFYLSADGRLMAVDTSNWSAPTPLFPTSIVAPSYPALPPNVYAVSRDGRRFLVNRPGRGTAPDRSR
jgi:Tol biopolymer transport system component